MQDIPLNTHFQFSMIGTYADVNNKILTADFSNQWDAYFGSYTYVLLPKSTSLEKLETKTSDFIMKQRKFPAGVDVKLNYQKLPDIHMHSAFLGEIKDNNSIDNILIISTIGLFILLLACFNFMNLATARSSQRIREIGVRKTLGALRTQLIFQFLGEAIIIAIISLIISVMIAELMLPQFSNLLSTKLTLNLFDNYEILLSMLAGAIVVGIFAGIYPSLYLSGFKPVLAIKNLESDFKNIKSGSSIRKILVIAQFGITICLMIGTIIVVKQLSFLKNHDVGFRKEQTLTIPFGTNINQKNYKTIENAFLSVSGVQYVSAGNSAPISDNVFDTSLFPKGLDGGGSLDVYVKFVDINYKNIYGLKLIAGKYFSKELSDNWRDAIVVNEATIKALGFNNPEDAIGKSYLIGTGGIKPVIIGVVKNFNIASLRTNIKPLIMLNNPNHFQEFSVRINPVNISGSIKGLEKVWKLYSPNYPFRYTFLNDFIKNLYQPEEKTSAIISTFSFLAILIACLGLIGLASFIFELRKKEIGVRKVLGASIPSLINILNGEFMKLVLIANVFALPTGYYFMNRWLQNFAYKIDLDIWIFLIVSIATIIIAFMTISFLAIKAATANPIESLKYE